MTNKFQSPKFETEEEGFGHLKVTPRFAGLGFILDLQSGAWNLDQEVRNETIGS